MSGRRRRGWRHRSPPARAITGAPVRSPQTLQLLDGGGAEGVAGGEHHGFALAAEALGELADGGGLAGAVDADEEDDLLVCACQTIASGRATGDEDAFDLVGQNLADFVGYIDFS